MAFELRGPRTTVFIDDAREEVFALPERYDERASILPWLRSRFYHSSVIHPDTVPMLRDEAHRLLDRREQELEPSLRSTRKVFSRDKQVERQIFETLFRQDPVWSLLHEILRLCDECGAAGAPIHCQGD
jgi:hypothetical protein